MTDENRRITIRLTPLEIFYAGTVGLMNRTKGIGKPGMYGIDQKNAGWDLDISGALCEAAAAKWLGVFWPNRWEGKQSCDVGENVEIRSTRLQNGCLILTDRDHDDRPYILAIPVEPDVTLAGWMFGYEAKVPEFWTQKDNGRPPAYFVPQSRLHSMYAFSRLPMKADSRPSSAFEGAGA